MVEACNIVRVLEMLKRNLLIVKQIKENMLGNSNTEKNSNNCRFNLQLNWEKNNRNIKDSSNKTDDNTNVSIISS